jgi:hypothetical protein
MLNTVKYMLIIIFMIILSFGICIIKKKLLLYRLRGLAAPPSPTFVKAKVDTYLGQLRPEQKLNGRIQVMMIQVLL